MLPAEHRLTRAADFSATTRHGRRAGRTHVIVHLRRPDPGPALAAPGSGGRSSAPASSVGGVRVGLVVSKSVGVAVVRHRVSRRLRHVAAALVGSLPPGTDVVLRALPAAAGASSVDLAADVRSGLVRLGALERTS